MATAASPTYREATSEADQALNLPTDAFVEILLRLPPSCRRWVRLVCRHWRDVIDDRTPASPPPKVLACFTSTRSVSACVVDDLESGRCREVWGISISPDTKGYVDITMVGTCNGLLCLCDNEQPRGAVSLVNPLTGDKLRVPPLPVSYRARYSAGKAYSFGFQPAAGLHKIVHLPCHGDATGGFNVLQVFTLGTASWRDVAVPGASCCLDAGLVSAGGATYWVTKGVERVVSFDLAGERVAFTAPLPVGARPGHRCRLVEFHGRLGLAASADRPTPAKTEVWVLGDGSGDRQGWTRRYSVRVQGVEQTLAAPHFAHAGEYVLAVQSKGYGYQGRKHVYAHRLRDAGRLPSGEVRSVRIREPGTAAAYCKDGYHLRTFAYVETREPLSVYRIYQRRKVHRQRKSCP